MKGSDCRLLQSRSIMLQHAIKVSDWISNNDIGDIYNNKGSDIPEGLEELRYIQDENGKENSSS